VFLDDGQYRENTDGAVSILGGSNHGERDLEVAKIIEIAKPDRRQGHIQRMLDRSD
jgi:hypothetical protein